MVGVNFLPCHWGHWVLRGTVSGSRCKPRKFSLRWLVHAEDKWTENATKTAVIRCGLDIMTITIKLKQSYGNYVVAISFLFPLCVPLQAASGDWTSGPITVQKLTSGPITGQKLTVQRPGFGYLHYKAEVFCVPSVFFIPLPQAVVKRLAEMGCGPSKQEAELIFVNKATSPVELLLSEGLQTLSLTAKWTR